MNITTRRQFIKQTAAGIGGLTFLGPMQLYAKAPTVKIAVYAPSHCALPVVYAFHNGILKKNGINAEIVYCANMPEIMKKLISGEVHFAQIMSPMVFKMQAGQMNAPEKSLAITQILGTNGGILGISSQSNIKKIQDLSGKCIGVHSPLMVHNIILQLLLEKYGLSNKNINIKTVPMTKLRESLIQKKIDAFINPEPLPTLLEAQKISKSLLMTRMFWRNHPCCALTTKKQLFENEQKMVQDVSRAISISALLLDNIAFRKENIAKIHNYKTPYQKIPLEHLQKAFKPRRSDFYPFPFLSSGEVIVKQMKKISLLPNEINATKIVRDVLQSDFAMKIIKQAASEAPGSSIPEKLEREEKFQLI